VPISFITNYGYTTRERVVEISKAWWIQYPDPAENPSNNPLGPRHDYLHRHDQPVMVFRTTEEILERRDWSELSSPSHWHPLNFSDGGSKLDLRARET